MPQSCKIPFGDFSEVVCIQIPKKNEKMNYNRLHKNINIQIHFLLQTMILIGIWVSERAPPPEILCRCTETVQTSFIRGLRLVKRGPFKSKPTCPNPFLINSLVSTQTDVVDGGSGSATVRNHQRDHSGSPSTPNFRSAIWLTLTFNTWSNKSDCFYVYQPPHLVIFSARWLDS